MAAAVAAVAAVEVVEIEACRRGEGREGSPTAMAVGCVCVACQMRDTISKTKRAAQQQKSSSIHEQHHGEQGRLSKATHTHGGRHGPGLQPERSQLVQERLGCGWPT